MLLGLAHVHANNVIHRALSPACVLVTEGGRAMLTGFDYAKPGPRVHTVANELPNVLDTHYAAPECQAMPERMTAASDVYAAGVIAFQLLTGQLPSGADAGPVDAGGASAEVMDLLRRMRDPLPTKRPGAAEALDDLRRARKRPAPDFRAPEGHVRATGDSAPGGLTPGDSAPGGLTPGGSASGGLTPDASGGLISDGRTISGSAPGDRTVNGPARNGRTPGRPVPDGHAINAPVHDGHMIDGHTVNGPVHDGRAPDVRAGGEVQERGPVLFERLRERFRRLSGR
ncbi:protein kinase [Streptosporangium lutulentum]